MHAEFLPDGARDLFSRNFYEFTQRGHCFWAINGGKVVDNKNSDHPFQCVRNVILVNYEKGIQDYFDRFSHMHYCDTRHGVGAFEKGQR